MRSILYLKCPFYSFISLFRPIYMGAIIAGIKYWYRKWCLILSLVF